MNKTDEKKYVIQKHHASTLHYDFSLEKEGVLKSWAIPKEPSTDPSVKRLAIETEDHELDYANFEGTIEEGKYGAGEVEIWDQGSYEEIKWEENEIIVELKGERLKGLFVLIRFKPDKEPENWLFFKKKK